MWCHFWINLCVYISNYSHSSIRLRCYFTNNVLYGFTVAEVKSWRQSAVTAVLTTRELEELEENRKRMLLRMMECSSEVSNNQVANYFLCAESNNNNNRFSNDISFGSRSLREIVCVTSGRNFEASEQIKNVGQKLLSKFLLNYKANLNYLLLYRLFH